MNLLLDTHVALSWIQDRPIAPAAEQALNNVGNRIYISAAVVWEIVVKQMLGKLTLEGDPEAEWEHNGFLTLPISAAHARATAELPLHHRDPFDRILVAQATVEGLTILTRDPLLSRYDVPIINA